MEICKCGRLYLHEVDDCPDVLRSALRELVDAVRLPTWLTITTVKERQDRLEAAVKRAEALL